jgi:CRP-like cAMP-binding protein
MKTDLQSIQIFSDLPSALLDELETNLHVKVYEKDSPVIWAQDECRAVYFILTGQVDIYRLASNGREQVLERLDAGEGFNLVPVFLRENDNQANARTVGAAEIIWIDKLRFMDLLDRFPELTFAVTVYFAQRLKGMVGLIENLALFSVRQRLAVFLLKEADRAEGDFSQRWTQDDLARQLGSVRDVIGRTLRKFEDEGLVRFQRQRILLLDRYALQQLAEDGEYDKSRRKK